MNVYQKESLLLGLHTIEEHINEMKDTISSFVNDPQFTYAASEAVSTYATRLAGNMQERLGFCYALSILGYRVKWDGEHAVDIEESEV